jgi:signal transduction histidine kinase
VAEDATTDKAEEEALSIAMQTGESTQKISKLETLNSRQIYVDIVASPIYQNLQNQEGKVEKKLTGIIAVLRDVDKQKRDEQQRSDFISTASHEMRTPVASIQGYLELALNPKISQIDDKTRTYLDKAYEATKHLGQLFQDLLTVSQTEDGRITNHPEVIEVISLLKEVCSGQIQPAARKGLKLECNLHDQNNGERVVTPLMHVKADPERLREVILNLVENAIKYTPEGSITISAELKDDSVVIGVKDTGSGIAEEDIVHLFQKFYRVDNSATREIGGTGLGLYISKQIIEMMDGKIWVESKLGEGSTFFVELPRVEPDQIVEQTNNPTPQPV